MPLRYSGSLKGSSCLDENSKHACSQYVLQSSTLRTTVCKKKLFNRLNSAVGACRYADTVAVALCRIYDGFTVYQLYRFLGAGFDAFQRSPAFCLIDDYFHRASPCERLWRSAPGIVEESLHVFCHIRRGDFKGLFLSRLGKEDDRIVIDHE